MLPWKSSSLLSRCQNEGRPCSRLSTVFKVTISTENCKPFSISNARIQDWNRAYGNLTDSGSTERNFSLCVAFFLVPKHCSRSPLQKGINWTQVGKKRMHRVRVRFTIWLYSKQNIQSVRYFKPFFNETEFELFMLSTVTTGLSLTSVTVQKSLKGQVIDS